MFKTQVRLPFSDLTTLFSCIEKEMCKLVVSPEDEWILAHMVDPLSRYNPLVVILSRNPPIKTGSFGESLRLIQATSNFYLVTPPNDKNFIEEILKKKCALTLVKDEVDYYFPFAEANSYKVFEKQLKQLRQSGILKKLISRYPLKDECGQSQKKTTAPPVPLRLGLGAIVIWCFGLLMAGAILLGEYLASRF